MGDWKDKTHIKNIGTILAFVTFFWGAWYTLVDFYSFAFGDWFGLVLRISGILFITFLAYAPYAFLFYVLDKTPYKSFFLGCASVLLVGDVVMRLSLFFGDLAVWGFVGAVVYPIVVIAIIGIIFLCSYIVRCIIIEHKLCMRFCHATRKTIGAILHKRVI